MLLCVFHLMVADVLYARHGVFFLWHSMVVVFLPWRSQQRKTTNKILTSTRMSRSHLVGFFFAIILQSSCPVVVGITLRCVIELSFIPGEFFSISWEIKECCLTACFCKKKHLAHFRNFCFFLQTGILSSVANKECGLPASLCKKTTRHVLDKKDKECSF